MSDVFDRPLEVAVARPERLTVLKIIEGNPKAAVLADNYEHALHLYADVLESAGEGFRAALFKMLSEWDGKSPTDEDIKNAVFEGIASHVKAELKEMVKKVSFA